MPMVGSLDEVIAPVLDGLRQWAGPLEGIRDEDMDEAERLLLEKVWSGRRGMYDFFPHLFADAFPEVDSVALADTALSGRLFYLALVLTDRVTDGEHPPSPRLLLESSWASMAATRLLSTHFPSNSPFWSYFQAYFCEYIRAVALEHHRHRHKVSAYSLEERYSIARGKSAMGKCAIAGLAVLAGSDERVAPLAASYDWYSCGRQIFDDVRDRDEDYRRGIYSPLVVQAIEHYRAGAGSDAELPSAVELGRIVYECGLADDHLTHADDCFARSLAAIDGWACSLWISVIQDAREMCRQRRADLWEIAEQQRRHSRQQRMARMVEADLDAFAPEAAQRAAKDFLLSNQNPEGSWKDFWTRGGVSTEWVTGYVGLACAGRPTDHTTARLAAAADWLRARRRPEGGWGYNPTWPVDADSTAFCMSFMHALGGPYPGQEADVTRLVAHQLGTDGGFSTYQPSAIRNPRAVGWCAPEPGVTSIATSALLRTAPDRHYAEIRRALDYLLRQQMAEGYWQSYWYLGAGGRIYSTVNSLDALDAARRRPELFEPPALSVFERAAGWLLSTQETDGSWGEPTVDRPGLPFATALAARSLMLARPGRPESRGALERAIGWLCRHQLADGSWPSYPILRVPAPEVIAPWAADSGESVRIMNQSADRYRVFTTATVLTTLERYCRGVA